MLSWKEMLSCGENMLGRNKAVEFDSIFGGSCGYQYILAGVFNNHDARRVVPYLMLLQLCFYDLEPCVVLLSMIVQRKRKGKRTERKKARHRLKK